MEDGPCTSQKKEKRKNTEGITKKYTHVEYIFKVEFLGSCGNWNYFPWNGWSYL